VRNVGINDKDGKQIATGTGFIIDSNGIIATNYHVISTLLKANNTLLVKMENGAYFPLQGLIDVDEENDVAIFKVDGKELPIIKLSKDYIPKQGEEIVVVGSPLGLETTVSDGIISSVRGQDGIIQITAPISPGSSGSPVLNSNGEAIGVATYLIKGGQNLNFAIPVKHVANLIKKSMMPKKKGIVDALSKAPAPDPMPNPFAVRLEKANALFADKKYKEALPEYVGLWLEGSNSNHPKTPYIMLQIGKCHIELGNDYLAWSWLRDLIKKYPTSKPEAFLAKGVISSKRWFLVTRTDRSSFFIDASSIKSLDKNNIRALVKTVSWKGNRLYSTVENDVFDCALGRTATVGLIKYDADGKVTNSHDAPSKREA